ncbi:MAG: SDR family oxidoreductase [Polyangiales bacterium]
MKILVVGGTGLIGTKLVRKLREHGHEALAASRNTGVNVATGEGLADAIHGVEVVVDVTQAPSFAEQAVHDFFQSSTKNLLAAGIKAGVKHLLALSVVGTARLQESGYFRGKIVQEELIKAGKLPYTLVQATQFFEFVPAILAASTVGEELHVPPALIQPMSSDDVASALGKLATGKPHNGTVELGGPEPLELEALLQRALRAKGDKRKVKVDPKARYFGAAISERTLVPGAHAKLGTARFEDYLSM